MFRILIALLFIPLSLHAKEYSGSAWVDDACKYYNGSAWVDCTKNRYTGSAWEEIEGSSDTSCDNLGTWDLYYDVDHTDGTTTACIDGDTETVVFTSVTAGGTTNKYVAWDGAGDKYVEIPATGISIANGRVEVDIVFPTSVDTTDASIFEWRDSTTEWVYVYLNDAGSDLQPVCSHKSDGTITTIVAADFTPATNTTYTVVCDWSSTSGEVYVAVNSTTATTSGKSIAAGTAPTTGVRFGEKFVNKVPSVAVRFDNIYMGASEQ